MKSLVIENFLKIKRFETQIVPIIGLYGKNQVGKSTIAKLMYALQDQYGEFSRKNSQSIYMGFISPEEQSELNSDISPKLHLDKKRWIYPISKEVIDYYSEKAKEVVFNQIATIPKYFISETAGEYAWNTLIPEGKKCVISTETSICNIKAQISRDVPLSRRKGDIYSVNIEQKFKSLRANIKLSSLDGKNLTDPMQSDFYSTLMLTNKAALNMKLSILAKSEGKPKDFSFAPLKIVRRGDDWHLHDKLPFLRNTRNLKLTKVLPLLIRYLLNRFFSKYYSITIFPNHTSPQIIPSNRGLYTLFSSVIRETLSVESIISDITLVERNYLNLRKKRLSEYKNKREEKSDSNDNVENEEKVLKLLHDIQGELVLQVHEGKRSDDSKMVFYNSKLNQKCDQSSLASSVITTADLNLFLDDFPPKGLLIYEEPEINLHPKFIAELCKLLATLHTTSADNKNESFSLIFTTHSDYFMNYLLVYLAQHYSLEEISSHYNVILLEEDDSSFTTSRTIEIGQRGFEANLYNSVDVDLFNSQMTLWKDK